MNPVKKTNIFQKLAENNPGKYDENFGQPWTNEEEIKLLRLVDKNKSIDDISKEHKRSAGGIRGKLSNIAYKMYNENKTIDEIQNKLKLLDNEQIQKAINKHKNKNKNKNEIGRAHV